MDKSDNKIDQLVFAFQSGDEKAGKELIDLFGGGVFPPEKLIGKYYRLLVHSVMDFDDKSLRSFIRGFTSDKDIAWRLRLPKQKTDVKASAVKTMEMLRLLVKDYDKEDLVSEMNYVLLKMAKRYKKRKKNVNFTGYLHATYMWELKTVIKRLMYHHDYLRRYRKKVWKEDIAGEEDNYSFEMPIEKIMQDNINIDLDLSWIHGIGCDELFLDLTVFERQILVWHDIEGLSDNQITKKTGMHINTIAKKRHAIYDKIKDKITDKEGDAAREDLHRFLRDM